MRSKSQEEENTDRFFMFSRGANQVRKKLEANTGVWAVHINGKDIGIKETNHPYASKYWEDHARKMGKKVELVPVGRLSEEPFHQEDQLDELRKSTLGSYLEKVATRIQYKHGINGILQNRAFIGSKPISLLKHTKGIKRAARRLTKEEDQLDEISRDTAYRYLHKTNTGEQYFTGKVERSPSGKAYIDKTAKQEERNRVKGIHRAIDRLAGKRKTSSYKPIDESLIKKVIRTRIQLQESLEYGRIVKGEGAGGFLYPSGHPSHTLSVTTGPSNNPNSIMSLGYAAGKETSWLHPDTKAKAQAHLNQWHKEKLPLEHSDVQDWIHRVHGYMRGMYKGSPDSDKPEHENTAWNVSNLRHLPDADPILNKDIHAGVNHIRQFYPDYEPQESHFKNAYWGKKPESNDK